MSQEQHVLRVHAWAQTDVGKQRNHNEDNFIIDLKLGLYGVADGMGGHEAGEVASETALKVVRKALQERKEELERLVQENSDKHRPQILKLVDETVQAATSAIYNLSKRKAGTRGMGTTLSMLVVLGNKGVVAHVGDSRIFLMRQNQVFQLTEDHSLVNEQLRLGLITEEEAERSPYKNVITRAVGAAENVKVDTLFIDILEGDRFMVCSDGLHGYLEEGEIGPYLAQEDPEKIPPALIDLANERGGKDNITAVLVHAEGTSATDRMRRTEITLRMDVLQRISIFRHLTYRELVKLMNITYLKGYNKDDKVFEESQPGDTLYVILQGEIELHRKDTHIATFGNGDHFGEMSLVDRGERSGTAVVTSEDAQLLTIGRKTFVELMREEQGIAVKVLWGFLKTMSARLRHTTDQLLR